MSGSAAIAMSRLQSIIPIDRNARTEALHQKVVPLQLAHEVTRPSRNRKMARDWGNGNNIVGLDAKQLRDYARHLERDHDISRNALNILEQNIVGSGIDVIPAPRLPGGDIDRELARDLKELWDDFWDRPEVTWMHDLGKTQALLARGWMRDGESMYQDLVGPVAALQHGTLVPYSIELLEADLLPLDLNDPARRIMQGVELNAWGRPVGYHIYKFHPGDPYTSWSLETKRVPAEYIRRLALIDRMHQVRGLSVFASVIARLEDIKDYEESERIAAKVAASLSAQIVKGLPDMYGSPEGVAARVITPNAPAYRQLQMRPGLIADDLLPGERIELVDSKRPNPNAEAFRNGQLRGVAGGLGTSYSSLSLDYNGSYSAQRQELVEKWGGYHKLGEAFIALAVRPMWKQFVFAAVNAGLITLPKGWKLRHACAATYIRPVMPWIDPLKEVVAKGEAQDRGWVSPQQNTLSMGNDPDDMLSQSKDWHEQRGTTPGASPDPADPNQDPNASVRQIVRSEAIRAAITEASK